MFTVQPKEAEGDLPVHVAIIMDGNGRWAKTRMMPRGYGHRRGADAVRRTVEAAGEMGIKYLTLFAFSSENWKRPKEEVDDLMSLMRRYLRQELAELHQRNVRLRFIGEREALASDLKALMATAEGQTAQNTGLNLILAVNYGSHHEIVSAAVRLAQDLACGAQSADKVCSSVFSGYLETADIPNPDLVIRTSGEKRLSNFLLWQAAYAELVFTDVLWPDFGRAELEEAVGEFRRRERRYGAAI